MLDAITAGEEFRLALRTCAAQQAQGRFAATGIYHIAGDAVGRRQPAMAAIPADEDALSQELLSMSGS